MNEKLRQNTQRYEILDDDRVEVVGYYIYKLSLSYKMRELTMPQCQHAF